MCGIIIYKGNPIPRKALFNIARINKHRGEEDGFGYVDLTNNKVTKTILHLDEVEDIKLDTDRKDKKDILKLNKRIIVINKELKEETEFMLFHHRKASAGGVHIDNTHPLKIKENVSYCQNGTVYSYWALRSYLRAFNNVKYSSTTDTEVVGKLIENLIDKKIPLKKIFKVITEIFDEIGVVIRIDKKKKELLIFKDEERSLYLYDTIHGFYLISEPIFELKKFNKCYRLDKGIYKLNEKGFRKIAGKKPKDVTEKLLEHLFKETKAFACDECKSKAKTVRIKDNDDYCLVCLTGDKDLEKEGKKKKKEITQLQGMVSSYDGDGYTANGRYINGIFEEYMR